MTKATAVQKNRILLENIFHLVLGKVSLVNSQPRVTQKSPKLGTKWEDAVTVKTTKANQRLFSKL